MIDCKSCGRKDQVYLCRTCQDELRELLVDLACGNELFIGGVQPTGRRGGSYLSYLQDAVHGQTRLGESARRSTEHSQPLPVNLTASELLDQTHETLIRWVEAVNTNTETLGMP